MVVASQLVAKVSTQGVDTSKAELKSMGAAVAETSGGFKSMLGHALSFIAGQAVFQLVGQAVSFLKTQTIDAVKLAMDHQQIMEQTAKVLKSTHDASGMTAQSLDDLAASLEKTTFFSKDVTEQGQNLLLTFTGIGKDVFPLATKTMLDMSKAMGQDIKSSAIQLGKALNDPEQGLTALTRVGVTFTDQQKEQIKAMVAAGNVAGAQKIMLAELQREFGGSADATGSFAGRLQILKDRFNDIKEHVGEALLPALDKLAGFVADDVLPAFGKVGDAIHYVHNVLRSVDTTPFTEAWQSVKEAVHEVGDAFSVLKNRIDPVKGDFDPLADVIANLAKGGLKFLTDRLWDAYVAISSFAQLINSGKGPIADFGKSFEQWLPGLERIGSLLSGQFKDGLHFATDSAKELGDWFRKSVVPALKDAEPGFSSLGHVLLDDVIPALIQGRGVMQDVAEHALKKLGPIVGDMIPPLIRFAGILSKEVGDGLKFLTPYIKDGTKELGKFADEIIDRAAPILKQLGKDLEAFEKLWVAAWPFLSKILKGVWDEIVGVVKIAWSLVSGIIKIGLDLLSGDWGRAWRDLKDMLGGIWDGIKQEIHGALEIINTWFGGLPGQALKWGENIIKSLADGITNATHFVTDAVHNVTQSISDHFPHSPVKIGPLRGLPESGAQIAQQLADGMQKAMPRLQATLQATLSPVVAPASFGHTTPYQFPAMQSSAPSYAQQGQGQPIVLVMDGHVMARGLLPYHVQAIRHDVGVRF